MYKCNFCIGDLGINGIADLKHKKISSHRSSFLPAGPSGPWAKMGTLGRKFFMLTVCNSIYALVTYAEITHFSMDFFLEFFSEIFFKSFSESFSKSFSKSFSEIFSEIFSKIFSENFSELFPKFSSKI